MADAHNLAAEFVNDASADGGENAEIVIAPSNGRPFGEGRLTVMDHAVPATRIDALVGEPGAEHVRPIVGKAEPRRRPHAAEIAIGGHRRS